MKADTEKSKERKKVLPCGMTTGFCEDCETGCAYAVTGDN